MAAATENIGFGVTVSTTYEQVRNGLNYIGDMT
jgi:hypothetical protein